MSRPIIDVQNLSKKYRLGQLGARTLREEAELLINRFWKRNGHAGSATKNSEPRGANKEQRTKNKEQSSSDFWALRDVSFSVQPGEVLGIIGRNGAGKSTLLKILSRITEPTGGEAIIRGRVASLLEVGTGFHPELSGRDNIYLNGAILGMKKAEIGRKFDEIIAFAEIEQFIDTPVKRYSSGMYVRLAFAVAAHLEPDILIVDEVLAVGDADFQKKCLGKMKNVSLQEGRTVLFVSHQLGMISSLCSRAVLLQNGVVAVAGRTSEVINKFFHSSNAAPHIIDFRTTGGGPGDSFGCLLYACIESNTGTPIDEIDIRRSFVVRMDFEVLKDVPKGPHPNFHFFDSRGEYAFAAVGSELVNSPLRRGIYSSRCYVPGSLLNDGVYSIGVALTFIHLGINVSFYDRRGLSLNVIDPIDETLMSSRGGYAGPFPGPVRPDLKWKTLQTS